MAHDIFISYSHKDKAIADAACAALEQEGVRVWIAPRDISPGAEWGGAIIDAINNAKAMVLIFSSNANDSPQIRREVERAVNKEVPILPFRIEAVEPTQSLEYFIGTLHWLDALSLPIDAHIGRLTHTIKALLTTPSADVDAAETIEANKAPRRATMPPIPPAPAHRTNWLMWSAIIVSLLGVIAIGMLWVIMSARKTAPVVINPPALPSTVADSGDDADEDETTSPRASAPRPAVPRPPAAPGAAQKWSGIAQRPGALLPDAFDMELKFAADGTITGMSTEVQITTTGIPVRAATVKGRVNGNNVTLTKSFGDENDVIEYKGVINDAHTEMSGTWRHGNDNGTFTASIGAGPDVKIPGLPDLP